LIFLEIKEEVDMTLEEATKKINECTNLKELVHAYNPLIMSSGNSDLAEDITVEFYRKMGVLFNNETN
jgi:hypothetical protein